MVPKNHSRRLVASPLIEKMESRILLSAGGGGFINTDFGIAGVVNGYAVLGANKDGSLIAEDNNHQLALLHPDGSFASAYNGPVPAKHPLQNVQSDGKYLTLNNGILSRYNVNGTLDTNFGINGSVTDFTTGTGVTDFRAESLAVDGTHIFVTGVARFHEFLFDEYHKLGVECINPNGTINLNFGTNGIASNTSSGLGTYMDTFYLQIGPDHNIYLAGDYDQNPQVERFSETGVFQGIIWENSDAEAEEVVGISFQPDHKILILMRHHWVNLDLLRCNADFTIDTTFGDQGHILVGPSQRFFDDNFPSALVLSNQGVIYVSASFNGYPDYGFQTFAVTSDGKPKKPKLSISGNVYDDMNGNGKRDGNETAPSLTQWVYLDTNGDGVAEAIAQTDANGNYSFYDLPPGNYTVNIYTFWWGPGTITQPTAGQYTIKLGPGKAITNLDFGIYNWYPD